MQIQAAAPMLGKILRLSVSVGDQVQEDDTLMVMEAMKMEIEVIAPASGRVTEIKVQPGQAVDADDSVATIETD